MTTQHAATQPAATLPIAHPDTLSQIASMAGPCITLTIPDRHPGAPETSQQTALRNLLDQTLAGTVIEPDWAANVRQQINRFADRFVGDGGAPGFVVYGNASGAQGYQLPGAQARGVIASHPRVVPLFETAAAAHSIVVLALSTKHVKLYVYADRVAERAALPAGIPADLDAAGHFHTGGEPGQSSTAGGKTGVRFGTSGERESARNSIEHFCALIDHGLAPYLAGRPLLLMGVREEIAAYRRVSHCNSILHSEVDGNVETLTSAEIGGLAERAAREEYQRQGSQVLAEFSEMRDRQRTAADPREILQAAIDGRVHQVCLRDGTELQGPNGEELLNAIAVETLRKGGEVFLLPQDQMSVTQSVCAILRY